MHDGIIGPVEFCIRIPGTELGTEILLIYNEDHDEDVKILARDATKLISSGEWKEFDLLLSKAQEDGIINDAVERKIQET